MKRPGRPHAKEIDSPLFHARAAKLSPVALDAGPLGGGGGLFASGGGGRAAEKKAAQAGDRRELVVEVFSRCGLLLENVLFQLKHTN